MKVYITSTAVTTVINDTSPCVIYEGVSARGPLVPMHSQILWLHMCLQCNHLSVLHSVLDK